MIDTAIVTVERQQRLNDRTALATFLAVVAGSLVVAYFTLSAAPEPLGLPLAMLLAASVVVAVKPVAGVYLTGFFIMVSDTSISPWYPFAKNLSSRESILYLGDKLIASPVELLLAVTLVAWLLHLLVDRRGTRFVKGGLLTPMLVFTGFLVLGFVLGQAKGGNRYVAIWEARPIFALPIMYLLVTNLFSSRWQYRRLAVLMLAGLVIHSVLAIQVWWGLSSIEREELVSLVDHQSAVQMNVVLLVVLAAFLLPRSPAAVKLLVPLAAVPVTYAWVVSQRRAAVVGLAAAIVLLLVLLSKLNARRLRFVAPILVLLAIAYLGAFWSSTSTVGFPAQAIKSVVAEEEASDRDQSSNLYRQIENINLVYTIKSSPVLGLGFGRPFLRPFPLANISSFVFHEYMPHNSFLWIWIKIGVAGFVTMLYLFGSAIRRGVTTVLRVTEGRDLVLSIAALSYVVMYLVFTYVDIGWDTRSMICLAIAMAVCTELARLPDGRPAPADVGSAPAAVAARP